MSIRKAIAMYASGPAGARLFPAKIRNWAYRVLIKELTREAKVASNPGEIFQTGAMTCDRESDFKVVTLVSSKDVEMLLWCVKSLFFYSEIRWDLWIIDGGLSGMDREMLQKHFPDSRVVLEPELSASVEKYLVSYPEIRDLRKHLVLAKKLIDAPLLLPKHKFLLLDSDVLFFRKPVELMDHLRHFEIDRFAFNMEQKGQINSGVAIVPASSVVLKSIEALLGSMTMIKKREVWAEQAIYSAIAQDCYDELPGVYAIAPVQIDDYRRLVSCHFVSTVRHRFYQEGIRKLRNDGFLQSIGRRGLHPVPKTPS